MNLVSSGDTELLVDKLISTGASKELVKFNGIIIGGSAGATSQFSEYFITPEQSYYGILQECSGIGIIKSNFMIDVHTNQYTIEKSEEESNRYLELLKTLSNKYNLKIYGICDNGAIIFDRTNLSYRLFGNIVEIKT